MQVSHKQTLASEDIGRTCNFAYDILRPPSKANEGRKRAQDQRMRASVTDECSKSMQDTLFAPHIATGGFARVDSAVVITRC